MKRELIEKAKQSDEKAWTELYEKTIKEAYYVALKVCGKEQDAVDLVQDAYLIAYQKIGQLQDAEHFQFWLNQIVANRCRDYLKKKKPLLFSELEQKDGTPLDWEEIREETQMAEFLDHKETVRLVAEILETLPADQKLCVILYYREEMRIGEIADALQISEGTVKSRLTYARKKVKTKIEELEKKGTKLYGMAPIPLLVLLLAKEAKATVVPTKLSAASAVGDGAVVAGVGGKLLLQGAAIKVLAGVVAVGIAVGGAALGRTANNDSMPSPGDAVVEVIEKGSEADKAMEAYEAFLAQRISERGLSMNYCAYVQLNDDDVPELLVANRKASDGIMCEGEVYRYQDGKVIFVDEINTRYAPYYLGNDSYVIGSTRMGRHFVGTENTIRTTSDYWDEETDERGNAVSVNGEWMFITEEEFDYYNWLPDREDREEEAFVETAIVINLYSSPFYKENMLEKCLDFSQAWTVKEKVESSGDVLTATYAFAGNQRCYLLVGYENSSYMGAYTGSYSTDRDRMTVCFDLEEGEILECTYRLDWTDDGYQLTQESEHGVLYLHEKEDTMILEREGWIDAFDVIDMVENWEDDFLEDGPNADYFPEEDNYI